MNFLLEILKQYFDIAIMGCRRMYYNEWKSVTRKGTDKLVRQP